MSTMPDESHTHLARDGLYYTTYQEMRNANVKSNEKRLRDLGLHSMKDSVRRQTPSHPKKLASTPNFEAPVRRSNRVRRVTPERLDLEKDSLEEQGPSKRAKTRRKTNTALRTLVLSDEDRKRLSNVPNWLNDLEEYLRMEENLSHQNLTSVMRQVTKLATGEGVTYGRWNDGVVFAKGRPIDISTDFDVLYVEAVDFEEEHGRDLGNGKFCAMVFPMVTAIVFLTVWHRVVAPTSHQKNEQLSALFSREPGANKSRNH